MNKLIISVLLGTLFLALPGCKSNSSADVQGDLQIGHEAEVTKEIDLKSLLRPTNEFVISTIPVTTVEKRKEQIEVEALGYVTYDTRQAGIISARISGRIERLYVRHRFQKIKKGEHIFDIYSPEISTAQQNLLHILKNDSNNDRLINAAKEKLLLLGMSQNQVTQVVKSGKPLQAIAVYSQYSGHIHESEGGLNMVRPEMGMNGSTYITEELTLKEGMYVQKGQTIFSVYNPEKVWVILNIYADHQSLIKPGDEVNIMLETNPEEVIHAKIDFIEPFYRSGSKNLTARVNLNNVGEKIPIGTQAKAIVYGIKKDGYWLSRSAVVSLGTDDIVFLKMKEGFTAHKIEVGIKHNESIEVTGGLTEQDSVALNAQFLIDSESFIRSANSSQ